MKIISLLISILLVTISPQIDAAEGFSKAKRKMYSQVFNNRGSTLYCDCSWSKKKVNLASCGLKNYFPKKRRKRAARTEAEHIIPASWLLKVNKKYRQCAIDSKLHKKSKRDYCSKYDPEFKKAHNDLVNLYPTVGQVNADRSNKPFLDKIRTEKDRYGKCNAISGSRGFVPPANRKGDIARVAFYMAKTYGVVYSNRQQKLFEAWDKLDPVSDEEREHNNRVVKVQGYGIEY